MLSEEINNVLWKPLCLPENNLPYITHGDSIYLYDAKGEKWLDANSGLWNMPLGYGNEHIVAGIKRQIDRLSYVNPYEFNTKVSDELADLLLRVLQQKFEKCLFTCSGSESLELAIKMIRIYHNLNNNLKRKKILTLKYSYHGNYYGSMSISSYDREIASKYGPLLDEIEEISVNVSNEGNVNISEEVIELIEKEKEYIAGIIIEPVLASAGVFEIPNKILLNMENFCRNNDIILVFDEVATGFGRTGTMFHFEKSGVVPDILTMSKGINNGMLPFGAVAVNHKIVNLCRENNEYIFHLSTQNCNPICCASAVETLQCLLANNSFIVKQVEEKGNKLKNKIEVALQNSVLFRYVRRVGLMLAIEFRFPNGEILDYNSIIKLKERLFKQKLIVEWSYIENVTSSIVLFPAFILEENDMMEIAEIIRNVVLKYEKRFNK